MTKNLMILAVNYPPYDGGRIGSSIRMYSLSQFFANQGYNVYVVIPRRFSKDRESPESHKNVSMIFYGSLFHYYDHAKNLPFRHKLIKRILSMAKRFAGVLFVNAVDLYSFRHTTLCERLIREKEISTIISSSPPLSVMSLAHKLKMHFGDKLLWIADVRDLSHMHPTGKSKKGYYLSRQEKSEADLIAASDAYLLVSLGMKRALETVFIKHGYGTAILNKGLIIENGFMDVALVKPQPEVLEFSLMARKEKRIILLYAGTGSLATRNNPAGGNKALDRFMSVLSENLEISKKYALILQGVIKNSTNYFSEVKTLLKYLILTPVSNVQMRANMSLADIGININTDVVYAPLIMGGKVYDYCASELALLLVFPDNAYSLQDFSKIHEEKPYFANVFDPESIKKVLEKIADDPDQLQKRKFSKVEMEIHSREYQFKKILGYLENSN